jgi:hypothetical protein
VGRTSWPLGSGAGRDPRPPKARKAPACLEWESASGAFCRALGDVRIGPEEVPADDPANVGYTHRREERYNSTTAAAAADTGIRPATPRRSGTLLVALLVLAIITAIVIFLAAFGLLGWIFS